MMGSKAHAIIPSCWYFLLHTSNRCPLAIVSGYPLGDKYAVEVPEGPAAQMNAKAEYAQVFNKCDTQPGGEMEPQHLRGHGPFGRLFSSRIGRLKRDAKGISALHCGVHQKNLQSASPRPSGLHLSWNLVFMWLLYNLTALIMFRVLGKGCLTKSQNYTTFSLF